MTGTPAVVGDAQELCIPMGQGLMKNAYVGRNLHRSPSKTIREPGIVSS